MAGKLEAFHQFRSRTNAKLLSKGNLQLKRFFNLDTQVYTDGALPSRTKELMGLVASAVLRCDDCITYHLIRCAEEGVTDEEFFETFNVILIVGGSITITPLNDSPVALNDAYTINEDTILTVSAPGVLANDSDVDGDALGAVLVSNPAHGSLTLNANVRGLMTVRLIDSEGNAVRGCDETTLKGDSCRPASLIAKRR